MWTWLWQRASSLVLIVLLPWHWLNPFYRPVRLAVLFFVVFHAMAGIRVMLTPEFENHTHIQVRFLH
jgi:succinate dehydrogenase hydrophobic anchor subunit